MGQRQETAPLRLRTGEVLTAAFHGNNAAWNCACGRKLPLIGHSRELENPIESSQVRCPDCNRRYHIVPQDKLMGRVAEVVELWEP